MVNKRELYAVEFEDAIRRFKKSVSAPEMPTIDIDVAVSIICEAFQKPNFIAESTCLAIRLANSDWLIERDAWDTNEEEAEIRTTLYNALKQLADGMMTKMYEVGMLSNNPHFYAYRRPINDHAILFSRLS